MDIVHSRSLEDVYFPSAGWGEKCKSPPGSNLLDKMAAAVQRRAPACLLPLACNPLQLICISDLYLYMSTSKYQRHSRVICLLPLCNPLQLIWLWPESSSPRNRLPMKSDTAWFQSHCHWPNFQGIWFIQALLFTHIYGSGNHILRRFFGMKTLPAADRTQAIESETWLKNSLRWTSHVPNCHECLFCHLTYLFHQLPDLPDLPTWYYSFTIHAMSFFKFFHVFGGINKLKKMIKLLTFTNVFFSCFTQGALMPPTEKIETKVW